MESVRSNNTAIRLTDFRIRCPWFGARSLSTNWTMTQSKRIMSCLFCPVSMFVHVVCLSVCPPVRLTARSYFYWLSLRNWIRHSDSVPTLIYLFTYFFLHSYPPSSGRHGVVAVDIFVSGRTKKKVQTVKRVTEKTGKTTTTTTPRRCYGEFVL